MEGRPRGLPAPTPKAMTQISPNSFGFTVAGARFVAHSRPGAAHEERQVRRTMGERRTTAPSGYDYALFLRARQLSGGRAALQAVSIRLRSWGGAIPQVARGGVRPLVDLKTGNVVWFNHLLCSAGDVRTREGADAMVVLLASMRCEDHEEDRTAMHDPSTLPHGSWRLCRLSASGGARCPPISNRWLTRATNRLMQMSAACGKAASGSKK